MASPHWLRFFGCVLLAAAPGLAADLVSVDATGSGSGNGTSAGFGLSPAVSADGRFVAFTSDASDLVATDTNGATDVFVRDRTLGTTELISVRTDGTDSGNGFAAGPSMSADGRFVTFRSAATDLVAGTGGVENIFVRDRQAGTTTLASIGLGGPANGNSTTPRIGRNGNIVVFVSSASNLVATDTNGVIDLFARDLAAGVTHLVTIDQTGTDSGNSTGLALSANLADLSADGRRIAFASDASNLVPGDTNSVGDVFVRDLDAAVTMLASRNIQGTGSGAEGSLSPTLSADGRFVAFGSGADDLVPLDTNDAVDVFRTDLDAGVVELVSIDPVTGDSVAGGAFLAGVTLAIDATGRRVAFVTTYDALVPGDGNGFLDVFVRDFADQSTFLVSARHRSGESGDGAALVDALGAFSDDGTRIAFTSSASDLTDLPDSNGGFDVFVRDLLTRDTFLASTRADGISTGNASASGQRLATDGGHIAFVSDASDLAALPDDNNQRDTFAATVPRRAVTDVPTLSPGMLVLLALVFVGLALRRL